VPLRLPKVVLPPLPLTGSTSFDKAFDLWRQDVSDLFARNFQEIENFPYGPAVYAYRTTSATIASATVSALNMDANLQDTDRMHTTANDQSRVTFNTAGFYVYAGYLPWKVTSTAGSFRQTSIWINGTTSLDEMTVPPRLSGSLQGIACPGVHYFAAQDYIQLVGNHDAGVNVGINATTAGPRPHLAAGILVEVPPK
jgi:hypothetical protein